MAAKQRRKQALMQRLLTGQVRFPGFEGEAWQEVKLEDVAKINQENLPESSDPEKGYYYIDLSAVDAGAVQLPTQKQRFADLPSRARRVLHRNDIIMATVRPHLLGYARCTFDTTDTLCSTGFAVITPNKPEYMDFIYQSLYSSSSQQQITALVTGSNYPAVNASQVGKLKIAWPLSNKERQKVADLLASCDQELDLHQQKLTTLRRQKQGLMQQLLTGKIRVNPE